MNSYTDGGVIVVENKSNLGVLWPGQKRLGTEGGNIIEEA